MDTESGAQVAIHDRFIYGSHPFYQHQLPAGNGYGSMFGSTQAALSARFNCSIEGFTQEDRRENEQWKGFSLYNGSHASKPVDFIEAEQTNYARASDPRLDVVDGNNLCTSEQRRKQSLFNNSHQVSATRRESSFEQDPGSLALKLSFTSADEAANGMRSSKRLRPSSPGNQSQLCQVDDCHADLKHAKEYHRRHKVCELHSKAPQSLVQKVMQRFCQQCSRFHPLPEFDEGKRSCRRRLAGHNKRRRKTDVATNGAPLSEVVKGTELLSIVTLLSQLQAAKAKGKMDANNNIDNESILQCLRKATSISQPSTAPLVGVSQNRYSIRGPPKSIQEAPTGIPSPLAGFSKDALVLFLRNVLQAQVTAPQNRAESQKMASQLFAKNQIMQPQQSHPGSSPEDQSRTMLADSLPFALAGKSSNSSGESDPGEFCLKQRKTKQYLGPADSYSQEEDLDTPPNSSATRPLEEQNFFPIECGGGGLRTVMDDRAVRSSDIELREEDLNLSPYSQRTGSAVANGRAVRSSEIELQEEDLNLSPYSQQPGSAVASDKPPSDSSDYASDQSPASSSSNGERSNGRLIFKLCDPKRVATLTRNDESEIQQWLSLSPGCLEGYLRPGCILLTVFLSMPRRTWDELLTNLRGNLKRLMRLSQSDLWTKGRIIVQVGHQRALIVNGKVKRIRFSKISNAPQLRSVRPLAVVAGQEATLSVCGYNLVAETRIICVYHGRYVLHEVPLSGSKANGLDSSSSFPKLNGEVQEVRFPGGPPNVFGRCFIEVERDFMGNTLPVIVADKDICSELQSLEVDLDSDSCWEATQQSEGFVSDESHTSKEAEAMNFLHELGWIFQSTSEQLSVYASADEVFQQIGLSRFKSVLKFAILRDWCAVVKKLLDLLFLFGIGDNAEVLHILSEVNLVHQAVKRKCKPMVDLLLHYIPEGVGARCSAFTPIAEGPGGFTPLHVAASMLDAEEIIDALTEDQDETGLHGWKSACDHLGRTPEWHAQNRGNLSYNKLVERKLLAKLSSSVRITIFDAPLNSGQVDSEPVGTQDMAAFGVSDFARRVSASSTQVCTSCRAAARLHPFRSARPQSRMYRPLMMMMVAVATVCATVALLFKTGPMLDVMYSLKWEGIMYGSV